MTYQERMRAKLTAALSPDLLEIHDNSAKHAGHDGHDPRGESHFHIKIISSKFEGLSRVARHRLIYGSITEEMAERVHAVVIESIAPSEIQP